MPDGIVTQSGSMEAFLAGRARVAAWLAMRARGLRSLSAAELSGYTGPNRDFAAGWRFPVQFADGITRHMELLLPIGFPWQPPRVALIDRPPFLTWPHIERDGLLCLAPSTVEIDPYEPAKVAAFMLDEAFGLVETLIRGDYESEFRAEFLSYWSYAADSGGPTFISLVQSVPPTRAIRLWRGKSLYLLAETDAELEHWLLNRFGKSPDGFKTGAAAFLWIGTPLLPREYPSTGQELRVLAAQAGSSAGALLSDLTRGCPQEIVTVLGMETAHGAALAGVIMPSPTLTKNGARDPLTKGFRPAAVPQTVLLARYFGGAKLLRRSIERVDAAWIHGRGQDPRTARLRTMRVAVVGCGSLGAPVAVALAQAGVGHLVLIDPDTLSWANIGRHRLGASCVGQPKAKALAEKIRSDFPHLTVDYRCADIDTVVRLHPADLDGCDLVVSATGSWAADGRLHAWHAETGHRVPILYAWMEANACAGHAVLIGSSDGCLRCGFDKTGLPKFRVTDWPNGATERQEPACGAVYQPYGPVELGYVSNLTAELALDVLLGEESRADHRVWIGAGKRLRDLGGTWSDAWRADPAFREEGGFTLCRPWPSASCATCSNAQAA